MRLLFGHHGLRGDLFLNLPAIRWLAQQGNTMSMPIHKQYADMAPLFLNAPHLHGIVITDEYESFPGPRDREALANRYDKIFNPMVPHAHPQWWKVGHQAGVVPLDYGFPTVLSVEECQIELTQWFDIDVRRDYVAFAPFAGWYNPNNDKRLSVERAQEVVDLIRAKGFKILQIGGPGEPVLEGVEFPQMSYFDSMRAILGTKLFVHTDTGMGWGVSGYKFPQLGLYGHRYYGAEFVKHIQPVNPQGVYLDADVVANIELDKISQSLDTILS